uniref:Uncharacterized protein n=1 Tax=Meloidogyne enterolobii TaxID=390850 RepID=A0A6V7VV71_MELEN|nr:unnamed protein product [Meloidogyne enterolobii]
MIKLKIKKRNLIKIKNKLKLLFGWPTVCIAALCSLIASLAFGYSLFLLLPSNDFQNNETSWYHNSIQLLIPFVCTFIALLISTLPYALPLTLLIRQWYSQRYLACNKEKNNPTEFRFIKKQPNKNCFLNGGGIMGNDCILIIHSNSLLGGNQPFLSDIWMVSEKNNRHISTKTFPKYLDNQTIKFIKMGVSAILKNFPLENNRINDCDYNQLKPEYSALLKYTKELGISINECFNEENKIVLIGPPEEIFGMCSFIKEEENNENNNLDKENNFVDLREEHLMEFEEQFLRFCVQRKRCLALAVNSTPPPINNNNNQNNLKNKNFCFVGLFAFEDAPLNIKYLNKLDKLIENGPKIIFIGDEHPALLIAKIMELNEKRPQKLINNNIFNNCPFIIGNGTAKIENSENNMERGNNENNKENSFLHQLQNQLLRRLKNRKNVDFVSTSTTTSISTSTTLFNSKVNNK